MTPAYDQRDDPRFPVSQAKGWIVGHENVSMPEQFNNVLLKIQFYFTQCPRILVNSHFGQVMKIHWQNANPPNIVS